MNQAEPIGAPQIKSVLELQALLRATEMTIDRDWAVITRELNDGIPPALSQAGRAGLWKSLTAGRCPRHVFEVPLCIVDQLAERRTAAGARFDGLKRLVGWATSTLSGEVPADWVAPPMEQLRAILPPERLIVQCDGIAIQGRIIRTDHRMSIRFPIVERIPTALSPERRKLLVDHVLDAHSSLRMVRFGLIGGDEQAQSAVVEIDLSGAPPNSIEPLLKYSADALQHAVRWASPPAELIQRESSCEILDS